jgi:hypothetical protein
MEPAADGTFRRSGNFRNLTGRKVKIIKQIDNLMVVGRQLNDIPQDFSPV